jgi:hypothetical protein
MAGLAESPIIGHGPKLQLFIPRTCYCNLL